MPWTDWFFSEEQVNIYYVGLSSARDYAKERIRRFPERKAGARKANAALADRVYVTTLWAIWDDAIADYEELAKEGGHTLTGEESPFQIVLNALFDVGDANLKSSTRSTLWQQLAYAHRHFVPPPFLAAFLKEAGSTGIGKKLETGYIEPRYRTWIIMSAVEDKLSEDFVSPWQLSVADGHPKDMVDDAAHELEQRNVQNQGEAGSEWDDDYA